MGAWNRNHTRQQPATSNHKFATTRANSTMISKPKKTFKRIFARAFDRSSDGLEKVGRQLRQQLAHTESDLSPPPRTPELQARTTVGELFPHDNLPSSPQGKGNVTLDYVREKLDAVCPDYEDVGDSTDPHENEKCVKLVHAVAKGMFNSFLDDTERTETALCKNLEIELLRERAAELVDKDRTIGTRFHALFSTCDQDDRTWSFEGNQNSERPIKSCKSYVTKQRLPDVAHYRENFPSQVFEMFLDNNHPNVVPFYRIQDHKGNCFAHSGIALHLHLQLHLNGNIAIQDAQLVDLSRFVRNHFEGQHLYNCIVRNKGDTVKPVLRKLILKPGLTSDHSDMPFHM